MRSQLCCYQKPFEIELVVLAARSFCSWMVLRSGRLFALSWLIYSVCLSFLNGRLLTNLLFLLSSRSSEWRLNNNLLWLLLFLPDVVFEFKLLRHFEVELFDDLRRPVVEVFRWDVVNLIWVRYHWFLRVDLRKFAWFRVFNGFITIVWFHINIFDLYRCMNNVWFLRRLIDLFLYIFFYCLIFRHLTQNFILLNLLYIIDWLHIIVSSWGLSWLVFTLFLSLYLRLVSGCYQRAVLLRS